MKDVEFKKKIEEWTSTQLNTLEEELKTKNEEALNDTTSKQQSLQKALDSKQKNLNDLKNFKKDFNQKQEAQFSKLEYKHKKVKELYDNFVKQQFNDEKYVKEWLKKGLKHIENEKDGKLLVGKSATVVKELASDKFEVENDTSVGVGFVFVNESMQFEYTKEKVTQQIYNELVHQLVKSIES